MRFLCFLSAVCALSVFVVAPLAAPRLARAQEAAPDTNKVFAEANALLQAKKYAEALKAYQKILTVSPDEEAVLQNAGMAAYFAGDYPTALSYYKKLKAGDKNSGFFRAKLVQVFQAAGDEKARDAERAELIALHLSGKDTSSLVKREDFCRDQYQVGNRRILVYEPFVFAPNKKGRFAVRYQFYVVGPDDKTETRIEAGWDTASKNAQGVYVPDTGLNAFYFDAYYPDGVWARRTMGLFTKEPTYNEAKTHVAAILAGKVRSSGGTQRTSVEPVAKPAP